MMLSTILAKADNFYMEASAIWVNELIEDVDNSYGGTLEVGYETAPTSLGWQHKLGLEVGLLSGSESEFGIDLETEVIPLLINYSLVFPINQDSYPDYEDSLSFYIGTGIGMSFVDTEAKAGLTVDDNDKVFTYQVFAGISYNIAENIHLSLGTRYIGAEDADFIGTDYDVFGTIAADLQIKVSF